MLALPHVPEHNSDFPHRIVCLTAETTETLYLLGEQDRIAGVSGFATRPPEARSKPRIATFSNANLDAILDLKPDMVLAFSDVQAEITRQLLLRGITVLHFNQRSISEIFAMIDVLSRLVGKPTEGQALVQHLREGLEKIAMLSRAFPFRPRVFFEEWNDPLISGITWVEELIEIAGGEVLFPELRGCGKAQDRVVDPADVVARNPQVILASWCGMKVNLQEIRSREGWQSINAVRNNHLYEVPSSCILQPGPAALTEGVRKIHGILANVAGLEPALILEPIEEANASLL
jgi:iron complex transport system substrate-binding protein